MLCMKCGKNTEDSQVFCDECLAQMRRFPVKPGTAVQLPNRSEPPVRKAPVKSTPSLKEQNKTLRKRVRRLAVLLVLSLVLLAGAVTLLLQLAPAETTHPTGIGQNYSARDSKPET